MFWKDRLDVKLVTQWVSLGKKSHSWGAIMEKALSCIPTNLDFINGWNSQKALLADLNAHVEICKYFR